MAEEPNTHIEHLAVHSLSNISVGTVLTLPKSTAHHVRVLRLAHGVRIRLFDGRGNRAEGIIQSIGNEKIICSVQRVEHIPIPERRVVLIQALPKGSKLDHIVRTTTELGIHAIHLAISERSISRPTSIRSLAKTDRLKRIAREACAQSGQAYSPEVYQPLGLIEAAKRAVTGTRRVVFWERSHQLVETALLNSGEPRLQLKEEVWIIVGPEGGLSSAEIGALADLGYCDASLGRTILRVETAASLTVGLLLYRLDRFKK